MPITARLSGPEAVGKILIGWTSSRGRCALQATCTDPVLCAIAALNVSGGAGVGRGTEGERSILGGSVLCVQVSSDTIRSDVRLSGELDFTTIDRLETVLDQLIRSGYRHIVLDLAELDFLAASGLRVLVHADTALHAAGGRLTLTNLPRIVRRVLVITELDKTLTID
jgi:anti-anti-sigma factor